MSARVSRIAESPGAAGPVLRAADEHAWHDRAGCRKTAPDLHWPPPSASPARILRAIKVCERCPVMETCRADALANHATYGQWGIRGGLTEQDRAYLIDVARRECRSPVQAGSTAARDDRCGSGHLLTEANTYTDPSGKVRCRTCRLESTRRQEAKRVMAREAAA